MLCVVDWVYGIAQVDNIVYVICADSPVMKTYSAETLSPLDQDIRVEGMRNPKDMVVCRDDRQLYVADKDYCIWRVSADDHSDQVKWLPTESTTDTFSVRTLSLTSGRLLVTSSDPPGLHEHNTTDRRLLRVIQLPGYVTALLHSVETTRGTIGAGPMGHEGARAPSL